MGARDRNPGTATFRRSDSKPLSNYLDSIGGIWHDELNAPHKPKDFTSGQRVLLWWKCEKNHAYQSTPANILIGQRCPYCSNRRVLKGFNDFASQAPSALSWWDQEKNDLLPSEVLASSSRKTHWLCKEGHSFVRPIRDAVQGLNCPFCTNKSLLAGYNDLQTLYPEIASELVSNKDNPIAANQILAVTTKVYEWRCGSGHIWVTSARARAQGHGCPYCSKRLLDSESNSLQALHPSLANEWDYQQNAPVTPSQVFDGGSKKYWWICSGGHSWEASIARRVSGRGCHICANRAVLSGFNDLASRYPDLAKEWDSGRNNKSSEEILYGSNQKAWWLCAKGHSFFTSPSKRILESSGCPYCSNKSVLEGFNDLASQKPALARRWSQKNSVSPATVFASSNKKFVFDCQLGHEWIVEPGSVSNEHYCPTCSNKAVEVGFNDIPTRFPDMASSFDASLNPGVDLKKIDPRSKAKITWRCQLGHIWHVAPANRVAGQGCPYCANKKVLRGFNDLEFKFPQIAAQWSPERNSLSPSEVNHASNSVYWWTCELGHAYRQAISNRTTRGQGCPYCSRRKLLKGFNDLAHELPQLASEWHPTRNGEIKPDMVISGTPKRIWWRCQEGHEWPAAPSTRAKGVGCPTCNKGGFDPSKPGVVYFLKNRVHQARKVGITNVDSSRLKSFQSIGWEIVHSIRLDDGNVVRAVETEFFRWLRKDRGLPQHLGKTEMWPLAGATETFADEGPSDAEIVEKLIEIRNLLRNES